MLMCGNTAASASCISEPARHLVIRGDTAADQRSGLIWKRCAVGMTWSKAEGTCTGEPRSLDQEAAGAVAAEAGPGWRVPTGRQLETLLIDTCDGPKIDTRAFPATEASDYGESAKFWTSTEALPGMFYYFDFANGWADMHSAGYGLSVLLVMEREAPDTTKP